MAGGKTAIAGQIAINSGADSAGVLKWVLNEYANNQTYVSSSSSGWQKTAEGAKRWDAVIDILLEDGVFLTTPLVVGNLLTDIELKVDGANSRHGAARVDRIGDIEADIDGSGLVKATIEVTGDGALV